jgi:hypothetical protein
MMRSDLQIGDLTKSSCEKMEIANSISGRSHLTCFLTFVPRPFNHWIIIPESYGYQSTGLMETQMENSDLA